MEDLTLKLKAKFRAFHKAYDLARCEMTDERTQGPIVALKVWEKTLQAVPLTRVEVRRFKNTRGDA